MADPFENEIRPDNVVFIRPSASAGVSLKDFLAYLPEHRYVFRPTRELWPSSSVNGALPWIKAGDEEIAPSRYLDQNNALQQMTWAPGEPEIIEDHLVVDGGMIKRLGSRTYNLYRTPRPIPGNSSMAELWKEHLVRIYDSYAEHIVYWLAQRIQHREIKVNHALVLGGSQGVGKDTLIEPIVEGVGRWNFEEVNPSQMLGRFNGWVKSVILRVSEGRDLGDVDRFAFYDHAKTYIAAPPEVLRVDEKNKKEYPVLNRAGVIITTNHKLDGLYLPPDDRCHYVAWSEATKEDFTPEYWSGLWSWYGNGGIDHVIAFLRELDIRGFDPKAPPPQTDAFKAIVQSNHNPEELELADLLESMGWPAVISVKDLLAEARSHRMFELVDNMAGSRNARKVPHRMDRAGYEVLPNPGTKDGRWKHNGVNVAIYARKGQTMPEKIDALRRCGVNA